MELESPAELPARNAHACVSCRAAKARCIRDPSSSEGRCQKCHRAGTECVVPTRQFGRKRGSTNKFTELNRALRQATQAGGGVDVLADALREMAKGGPISPLTSHSGMHSASPPVASGSGTSPYHNPSPTSALHDPGRELASILGIPPESTRADNSDGSEGDGGTGVLSNPLGLLSDVTLDNSNGGRRAPSGPTVGAKLTLSDLGVLLDDITAHMDGFEFIYRGFDPAGGAYSSSDRSDYFRPVNLERLGESNEARWTDFTPRTNALLTPEIDDEELDPIFQGIVTEEEVRELFIFYHTYLLPVTLALDPVVCSPTFLRKTSPFLLTAICAGASNFIPTGNPGLTRRLYKHFSKVADVVKVRGYRSISIIHAFTLGCGWASPAQHISREQSWSNLMYAASLAVELGLHSMFSSTPAPHLDSVPWSEELRLWGPDLREEGAERLERHAARAWLHLYIWGSGLARTMGRPWVTRADEFGTRLDGWHDAPFALPEDKITCAIIDLRVMCQIQLIPRIISVATPYSELRYELNMAFDHWKRKWLGFADAPLYSTSNPIERSYPLLLLRHSKVHLFSLALKHHPRGDGTILLDCFRASLDVVQHVVNELQGSSNLRYMVNNISAMCLYSAVCAAKCLALLKPEDQTISLYCTSLLGKLSMLMVEAGTTPKHRMGTCQLCGEHLRAFLVKHGHTLLPAQLPQSVAHSPAAGEDVVDWLPLIDASGWFLDASDMSTPDFDVDLWNASAAM